MVVVVVVVVVAVELQPIALEGIAQRDSCNEAKHSHIHKWHSH